MGKEDSKTTLEFQMLATRMRWIDVRNELKQEECSGEQSGQFCLLKQHETDAGSAAEFQESASVASGADEPDRAVVASTVHDAGNQCQTDGHDTRKK